MARRGAYGIVTPSIRLQVPERGHLNVSASTWKDLSSDDFFWRLVDRKILKVSQTSRSDVQLQGTSYVGRVQLGGFELELSEKVDGALAGLLSYASDSAFRVETLRSPTTEAGPLMRILISQFLDSVRKYAAAGREFAYERRLVKSSLGGGQLDVTDTVRLRSRGMRHLMALRRDFGSHRTPKNRTLAAALRQVQLLNRDWPLSPNDLMRSRALDELFSDCKDIEVLYGARERFVELAESLLADPSEPDRDLLRLASVVLAHESFEADLDRVGTFSPRSWFINLETLFERAVLIAMRRAIPSGYKVRKVRKGEADSHFVFPGSSLLDAAPDLVVSLGDQVIAVGDVKYKDLEGVPDASDLYQLIVHARAFDSDTAFLVYPGEALGISLLGQAATGCWVSVLTVAPRQLDTDLSEGLKRMKAVPA